MQPKAQGPSEPKRTERSGSAVPADARPARPARAARGCRPMEGGELPRWPSPHLHETAPGNEGALRQLLRAPFSVVNTMETSQLGTSLFKKLLARPAQKRR